MHQNRFNHGPRLPAAIPRPHDARMFGILWLYKSRRKAMNEWGGERIKKIVEREGDEWANTRRKWTEEQKNQGRRGQEKTIRERRGRTSKYRKDEPEKKKTRGRVKQRKGIVESPSKLQQLGASSSQHRTTQEQKNTDDTDTEKKGRKPENMTSNTRIPSRHWGRQGEQEKQKETKQRKARPEEKHTKNRGRGEESSFGQSSIYIPMKTNHLKS